MSYTKNPKDKGLHNEDGSHKLVSDVEDVDKWNKDIREHLLEHEEEDNE